jgi:hypothetical protein
MAYDEKLADRVRKALGKKPGLDEKRMFGGLAFLLRGNMCCGVIADELMARVDPTRTGEYLKKPHTRPFDFTGKPMKGWIVVKPSGIATPSALAKWVGEAVAHTSTLPAK